MSPEPPRALQGTPQPLPSPCAGVCSHWPPPAAAPVPCATACAAGHLQPRGGHVGSPGWPLAGGDRAWLPARHPPRPACVPATPLDLQGERLGHWCGTGGGVKCPRAAPTSPARAVPPQQDSPLRVCRDSKLPPCRLPALSREGTRRVRDGDGRLGILGVSSQGWPATDRQQGEPLPWGQHLRTDLLHAQPPAAGLSLHKAMLKPALFPRASPPGHRYCQRKRSASSGQRGKKAVSTVFFFLILS